MNDYWEKMGNTSILGNHQMSLGSFHVEKMMRSDDSPVKKPGGMMALGSPITQPALKFCSTTATSFNMFQSDQRHWDLTEATSTDSPDTIYLL